MPHKCFIAFMLLLCSSMLACRDDNVFTEPGNPRAHVFSICQSGNALSAERAAVCPAMQTFLQQALQWQQTADGQHSPQFAFAGSSGICLTSQLNSTPSLADWYALANHLLYAQQHDYSYLAYFGQDAAPGQVPLLSDVNCQRRFAIPADWYFWQLDKPITEQLALASYEVLPVAQTCPSLASSLPGASEKPSEGRQLAQFFTKLDTIQAMEQQLLHKPQPLLPTDMFAPNWLHERWPHLAALVQHMDLLAPPIVWSRGYFDLIRKYNPQLMPDYFLQPAEAKADKATLVELYSQAKEWIWLRNGSSRQGVGDVDIFANEVLPLLQHPVRLITTDGDRDIPGDLAPGTAAKLLASKYIVAWYTQNYDGSMAHAKWRPIPIGLDLHCCNGLAFGRKWQSLRQAQQQAQPWKERQPSILVDAMGRTHRERKQVQSLLQGYSHIESSQDYIPFEQALARYGRYQFVVSPRGNGMDCHRTWDVLSMGAIPIVRSSALNPLYQDLPVMVVQSWQELLDPDATSRWLANNSHKRANFQVFHHLSRAYWLDRIDIVMIDNLSK